MPLLDLIPAWALSSLLVSLRIAPVFAVAPPFTLVRIPGVVRAMLGMGLAACLVGVHPEMAQVAKLGAAGLAAAALRELLVGMIFVAAFHLAYGALYLAGRTIDVQAGFGLALLIDPTSRNQTPLVGTLFAYAAAAVFFAMDGHISLLTLLANSLDAVPLGTGGPISSLARLTAFISAVSLTGLGVAGGVILCLILVDIAIAALSRTVPQMNVLVLGIQVKTILLLMILPASFGAAGALFARLSTQTLEAIPGLL